MRSIRIWLCIYTGILLVACGSQATPTQRVIDTATVEPTPTITPKPTSTLLKPTSTSEPPAPSSTATPSSSATPTSAATPIDCTQGWTRLGIGTVAKVAGAENDPPNRVRSEPVNGNNIIAQIFPGEIVKVIEGPVCTEDLVFWKVEYGGTSGGVGWTAEGDRSGYWLDPYAYMPESVRLSAYGVSFTIPGSWSNTPESEIVGNGSDSYCKWPEHVKITLTNYPAQSGWKPVIYVYITEQMPDWSPICPGAPLLRVHQQTLSRGERLLIGSKNAQPIFNSELIFTYTGKTPDGKHTAIVFFPVNFPLLAYSFQNLDLPFGGIPFNLESQDWGAYYQAVGLQLEAANDSDFTPHLDLLDAVAESIDVTVP